LAEVAPDFAERFPASVRLSSDATGTWEQRVDETFELGLGVLLDGISRATAPRRARRADRS
jgi:hypothetical protein